MSNNLKTSSTSSDSNTVPTSNIWDTAFKLLKHKHTRFLGIFVLIIGTITPLLLIVLPSRVPQPCYEVSFELLNQYVIALALDNGIR